MEPVHTETYKGREIKIYQDDGYESPNEWGNEDLFLVAFHPDFSVDRKGFDKETCIEIMHDDKHPVRKKYHVFGLEAYIHSGIMLALSRRGNFPDRRWDVSQLGLVFVEKKQWKTITKADKAALSLIGEWNDYLSGNVYGYVIGDDGDSCWGYYGDYEEYCLKEARASVDSILEQERKLRMKKLKAYIKHRVPLEKRVFA